MIRTDGVRAIALLETAKGILALLLGIKLFFYLNQHTQATGDTLLEHFHVSSGNTLSHLLIKTFSQLQNKDLWLIASGALAYSIVRFGEAYGLWYHKRWAEWFSALSTAVYIPFEVIEVFRNFSLLTLGLLTLNILIVAYLSRVLWKNQTAPS